MPTPGEVAMSQTRRARLLLHRYLPPYTLINSKNSVWRCFNVSKQGSHVSWKTWKNIDRFPSHRKHTENIPRKNWKYHSINFYMIMENKEWGSWLIRNSTTAKPCKNNVFFSTEDTDKVSCSPNIKVLLSSASICWSAWVTFQYLMHVVLTMSSFTQVGSVEITSQVKVLLHTDADMTVTQIMDNPKVQSCDIIKTVSDSKVFQ